MISVTRDISSRSESEELAERGAEELEGSSPPGLSRVHRVPVEVFLRAATHPVQPVPLGVDLSTLRRVGSTLTTWHQRVLDLLCSLRCNVEERKDQQKKATEFVRDCGAADLDGARSRRLC